MSNAEDTASAVRAIVVPTQSQPLSQSLASLSHFSNDELLAALRLYFNNQDPVVRRRAIRLAGRIDWATPEVLNELVRLLHNDTAWTVREAAAMSIGEVEHRAIGDINVHETLVTSVLFERSHFVRDAAMASLRGLEERPETVVAELTNALSDSRHRVRVRAVQAIPKLVKTVNDATLQQMIALTSDSHEKVRAAALRALCDVGKEALPALPDIVGCIFDQKPHVAFQARQALNASRQFFPRNWKWATDLHVFRSASATLDALLKHFDPASSACQAFVEICSRRATWNAKARAADIPDISHKPREAVDSLITALSNATAPEKRERACRREYVWLLTRLVRILIAEWLETT